MKFSIPHNWQNDLVQSIDLTYADDFYGKLNADAVGGGLPANACPSTSFKNIGREIQKIHRQGLRFNYLLSSNCLNNQELSVNTHERLSGLLDYLEASGVDSVTVSMPYICGFIKKHYPRFKIHVSTMAQVDTPDKAKFWEDLGVTKITLYEVRVNRNFELIKKIRETVGCSLQLIANNACLYDCPFTIYHALLGAHSAQEGHILKGFSIDFYRIMCIYEKLKDPVNFIRADWIRPEDLSSYEDLGIDYIKIVSRGMTTAAIKSIVKAYTDREHNGNLLDLFYSHQKNVDLNKLDIIRLLRFFFHPGLINIFKLLKLKKLVINLDKAVYIDNAGLNGFLKELQTKDCGRSYCDSCNWCRTITSRVVKIDTRAVTAMAKNYKKLIDELASGGLFNYS
ncbi:MAG: U32 family peptidase [Candidatus Omnitrophica bacterium]|nr:U32 family peptidase [Candidatus Omnitrophota bacterium]